MSNSSEGNTIGRLLYIIAATYTGMIGYTMHHSVGWGIVDAILAPIVWVKWLICHEVTLNIITKTFDFFLN